MAVHIAFERLEKTREWNAEKIAYANYADFLSPGRKDGSSSRMCKLHESQPGIWLSPVFTSSCSFSSSVAR
jgi:hypothetical protein